MREKKVISNPEQNRIEEMPVVLVVEDDAALNRLIRIRLKREGFRTDSASTGIEAISRVGNQPDVLILLDFILPDMNGKQFIKKLSEEGCVIPFVIMTGFGDEKIAVDMIKLGARDYIVKDTNFIDILPQKIKKVCVELEKEKKLAIAEEALRENEENLRSLMESASDFVVFRLIVNRESLYQADVVFVSPSIKDIVGLNDPYRFGTWFETIHENDVKRVVQASRQSWINGKPFDQIMRTYHNKKKEWCWIHLIANPVFDMNGKPTHFNGLIIDITDQKEIEEEIKMHRDHLETLIKDRIAELESFTYSVSHDLRAPLRAIGGFSKILFEEYGNKLDENGKRILNQIRSNIRTMDQLISNLLTLSHLGRKEINLRSIDVKGLVKTVFNEISQQPSKTQLYIQKNNIPFIYADRVMIKQLFVNLLSNAVKFSKYKEEPCVEVGYLTKGNENIYYVKDNGVGFEKQYADKLFGIFQRLHAKDEFEGTGVGLAIVKRIVSRHGGRIWADGKEDEGATFYFTLPVSNIQSKK